MVDVVHVVARAEPIADRNAELIEDRSEEPIVDRSEALGPNAPSDPPLHANRFATRRHPSATGKTMSRISMTSRRRALTPKPRAARVRVAVAGEVADVVVAAVAAAGVARVEPNSLSDRPSG